MFSTALFSNKLVSSFVVAHAVLNSSIVVIGLIAFCVVSVILLDSVVVS